MTQSLGHVVIVDDEEELAEILMESFELENYTVTVFHSAEAALAEIDSLTFDSIVSDAHMGGMSGMDFLKELKKRDLGSYSFFLCTGDLEITESELKEAGGTALISKPYNLFELIEVVANSIKE